MPWPPLSQAAKAVAGVGCTGGALDDGGAELPPLPAWQQQALASLQLAGPGANTEVTIRRQAARGGGNGSGSGSRNGGGEAAAEGPVDPRLLAGVRVLCAPSAAALGGKAASVERLGRWDAPLAPAAELAALRALTGLCAIALSQFRGSLEEDAALLAAAAAPAGGQEAAQQAQRQLGEDEQLAVRFRMEKKQLLLEALGTVSHRIQQLAAGSGAPAGAPGSGRQPAGSGRQPSGGGRGKGKAAGAKNGGRGFGK